MWELLNASQRDSRLMQKPYANRREATPRKDAFSVARDAERDWRPNPRMGKASSVPTRKEVTIVFALCSACKRIASTSARHTTKPKKRSDRAPKFGDVITAGHGIQNVRYESRCGHRNAVIVQDDVRQMDSTLFDGI